MAVLAPNPPGMSVVQSRAQLLLWVGGQWQALCFPQIFPGLHQALQLESPGLGPLQAANSSQGPTKEHPLLEPRVLGSAAPLAPPQPTLSC